jgi:toxin FitB
MIVLDTNVISEAMKPQANPAVRAWLNEQVAETLYLTSVTLAEMLFGIAVLPAGRRRNSLTRALDGLLELFGDRVLPFDTDAARHHAALAVAASRGFIVASRDTSPYEAGGLRVVDPWQS